MMNHAGRASLPERHVERIWHQLGAQMGLHRPADNPAAERVENHGQVEEAGPGRDVGYIGDPQAIGRGGREVAFDQIRRRPRPGVALGGDYPTAPAHSA